MEALTGVTILCWLMGTAEGAPELHDGRLRMLWEKLVDTPVRGVVYEAAGPLDPGLYTRGRTVAAAAHATWMIPLRGARGRSRRPRVVARGRRAMPSLPCSPVEDGGGR